MARLDREQLHRRSAKTRSRLHAPIVLALAALVGHLAGRASAADHAPRASSHQRSVKALKAPPLSEAAPIVAELPSDDITPVPTNQASEMEPAGDSTPEPLVEEAGPQSTPGDGTCPAGMVAVHGEYCPALAHRCLEYISQKRDRCAEFAEGSRCFGTPEEMTFCIDRFEYPNQAGVRPEVGMTYLEAKDSCEAQGKRLCTDHEWSLACEGTTRLPYPHGYARDANACNYDKPYIIPDDNAFARDESRDAEIERLDQREPSGERDQCVSPFGVHDMTGNVDEWVLNTAGVPGGRPYVSGLKGGYWGPVRNRCRPITTDHNEWHSGYQIGFRCCSDLDGGGASTSSEYDEPPRLEGPRAQLPGAAADFPG